jgi:hypothetical protein
MGHNWIQLVQGPHRVTISSCPRMTAAAMASAVVGRRATTPRSAARGMTATATAAERATAVAPRGRPVNAVSSPNQSVAVQVEFESKI